MRENDILMIVATTDLLNPAGDIVNANTMFIENSNKPGITKVKINDNCYKLIFDNVSIVTGKFQKFSMHYKHIIVNI